MKPTIKPIVPVVASSLLIVLFFYTAISKLSDYDSFRTTLHESPIPGRYVAFVAIALPVSELLVCALLFFPNTRRVGLWASLFMITAFTFYIFYMLLFVPELPCSCGGVLRQLTWAQHAWFNVFFTLVAATGLYYETKRLYNSCRPAATGEAENLSTE